MADYYEKRLEYILDNGLECRCCPLHRECDGQVKQGRNGPVLPACAETDFKDLLIRERVNAVFREVTAHD
jgi:hypothetical protein